MSRKRRIFDIDMPDEPEAPEATPGAEPARRGPMASAIAENAEALQRRKSAAEAIREENDALAHEYVAQREAGNVVQHVALDQVHMKMLARDRLPSDDYELGELVTSIRELGLSNPIRVLPRVGEQGFELVQGFRRLAAYRQLHEETGDVIWSAIPALILPGEDNVAGLYRRMVDENVIRKDLSFAEMAHAAQNYAADPRTSVHDLSSAVAELFQSAAYSKRSYIRSFAYLLDRIGQYLDFPSEIPRALGVALARQVKERPEVVGLIRADLDGWVNRSIADELAVLRRHAGFGEAGEEPDAKAATSRKKGVDGQGARTKTTFLMDSSAGQVKCTAAPGRLEIQVARDFSAIDRARLERAIASLIDGLG